MSEIDARALLCEPGNNRRQWLEITSVPGGVLFEGRFGYQHAPTRWFSQHVDANRNDDVGRVAASRQPDGKGAIIGSGPIGGQMQSDGGCQTKKAMVVDFGSIDAQIIGLLHPD